MTRKEAFDKWGLVQHSLKTMVDLFCLSGREIVQNDVRITQADYSAWVERQRQLYEQMLDEFEAKAMDAVEATKEALGHD